jgi:hypothetical protein
VGEFCCLFGHFARQRRIFTFISGVLCIISGAYDWISTLDRENLWQISKYMFREQVKLQLSNSIDRTSRWTCGLKHRSGLARFVTSRVRVPLRARMFFSCVCFVLCRQLPVFRRSHTLCVVYKPSQWGGLGPRWAVKPQKRNSMEQIRSWDAKTLRSSR